MSVEPSIENQRAAGVVLHRLVRPSVHPRSCLNCANCWHHEASVGEETSTGPSGWVCEGRTGVQNLRSFPFRTEQKCFVPNAEGRRDLPRTLKNNHMPTDSQIPETGRSLSVATGSAPSSVEHLRTTLNGVLFAAEAEYQKKTGKTYVPKYANLRVEVSYQLLAAIREALPNID